MIRHRRRLLAGLVGFAFGASAQSRLAPSRALKLYHSHTGERLAITYFDNGSYLPEAIVEIPVNEILAVTPESKHGNSVGRAIGLGAAAGAAATISILMILIAVAND